MEKFPKFTVKPRNKKDAKSFVWNHFGNLCSRDDDKISDTRNVYCIACFVAEHIKTYNESVSTTNLSQHLQDAHSILYSLFLEQNDILLRLMLC